MGAPPTDPVVTFKSDDTVVKSPHDKRLYRLLRLHNGLSSLLIHDPEIYPDTPGGGGGRGESEEVEDEDDDDEEEEEDDLEEDEEEEEEEEEEEKQGRDPSSAPSQTKKAAAAMCVGMGSFSDPPEAQGLAHFLEHMLFMGSGEFPDENEYDSYLSKHGGSSNAYTEAEHTCYHFEVKREFLKGALQRFSQFFISPLVKMEAMEREVLAVDSEFNQVLQNDACRLQQLQFHTSLAGHPFNRFFWGNKRSLADAIEKGVDLRECLLKIFQDQYHGGVMKLVVIGGEPLDLLESWVVELFGRIKEGSQVQFTTTKEMPIWKAGKIYWLEAVKDVHILELTWALPCLRQNYLKKAEDYLAHVLGHEGRGSLHSFFKSKGWATSLSAGVGDEGTHRSSVAYIFGMSIHLTDSGLKQIFLIIGYIYQYFKLLREIAPQEWIFKELQDIGNMEFRFAEEQPQDDYAAELAENLLIYPAEHVIYGDYAYTLWDEDMVRHLLTFFYPENMRIDIVSKSIDSSKEFLQEPWFESSYVEDDVPPSLLKLWRDPPEVDASLHLPMRNEFIPCDFSLRANQLENDILCLSSPRYILDDAEMKLWYKLDITFRVPRANAFFRINLNGAYDNAKTCMMTELFVLLLKDELNEIIYQASVAKLETSVSCSGDKLELKFYGFNEKLPILLSKVLAITNSFLPTGDRFKVVREDFERTLRNTNMKPLSHSSYLRLQVLCKSFYDVDEKLRCLGELCLDDLKAFIFKLRSKLYIEGLCHGNMLEKEAFSLVDAFRINLPGSALPIEKRHHEQIIRLPSFSNLVRDVKVKNKSERNSVVELYYQIEPEVGVELIKQKALMDLFYEIVEEPLFNQLRTKEQLGYVVESSPRTTYRTYGYCFCVQSSKYDPVYLLGRIDKFIDSVEEILDGLNDDTFNSYRSGLICKLLEKDPSLAYETNRFWGQIIDKRYMFDFSEKEAEALGGTQKTDVVTWYRTYLHPSSPSCRRLAVQVWGCNADLNEAMLHRPESMKAIGDVEEFKLSADYYPSLC
ncbi:hypothetical protein MLD38_017436 [Melastoma candidum]|uniref:Uncharacterized protein n=1 Tax=Melastoma candidum TaxID=119954 RepID=A0ACB9QSJ1_9MYRT|nr:hypothetical protein MLD38_017436 [Melastoma candidum]